MNKKTISRFKLAALGTTLALAAGCTTDNFYENPSPAGRANASQTSAPVATAPMPTKPRETFSPVSGVTNAVISANTEKTPAWNEDRTSLGSDKIYFAFDKSGIKSGGRFKLDEVAYFLKCNPQVWLRIEGNCDERGTEEFNRELGVRRAEASRDYLLTIGVDPARIQTLSRGKDNPAVTGGQGTDRALNRRDEFVVLTSDKLL